MLMNKILLALSGISLFLLVMLMFLFSPSEAGPFGILLFFVLSYVFFLGLAVFCCRLFFTMLGRVNKIHSGNLRAKSFRYGSIVALAPVFLLLCVSFGGLSIPVVLLVVLIEAALLFLASRNIV